MLFFQDVFQALSTNEIPERETFALSNVFERILLNAVEVIEKRMYEYIEGDLFHLSLMTLAKSLQYIICTRFVLKVLVPGVKTVIVHKTLYMSMKITVLTPGTKTFNTNLVFFVCKIYIN